MTDARARLARLRAAAEVPTDAAALAIFRIVLGSIGVVSVARIYAYGWADELFFRSRFQFRYFGFGWLPEPTPARVHAALITAAVCGALVATGTFYRVAIIGYALAFAFIELVDVTNYLNHYYLLSWLLVLAAILPLHRAYSVDARRLGLSPYLPAWCTWALRFQVGIVYFYAGLAKFNTDWLLHAQPLQIWLSSRTETPLIGPLLDQLWVAYFMSWAGFLYDTSIAFFLLAGRTRPFAFAAVVAFHVATRALFPIGMFPFIMVGSALVFFSPSWPRRWLGPRSVAPRPPPARSSRWFEAGATVFGLFVLFHVAMPLRCHLYGGNVAWHEQGMRFSWRVMLREKNGAVTYRVRDLDTGKLTEVNPRKYLTDRQAREFSSQPDLILQLAHRIAADRRLLGERVAVHADTRVSWNGRPGAPLIDPEVDLAQVVDGVARASWILPAPTQQPARLSRVASR